MKSAQPLRLENKRDIDIAMETKRGAGGSGLSTFTGCEDVKSRTCIVVLLISMYETGSLQLVVTITQIES